MSADVLADRFLRLAYRFGRALDARHAPQVSLFDAEVDALPAPPAGWQPPKRVTACEDGYAPGPNCRRCGGTRWGTKPSPYGAQRYCKDCHQRRVNANRRARRAR